MNNLKLSVKPTEYFGYRDHERKNMIIVKLDNNTKDLLKRIEKINSLNCEISGFEKYVCLLTGFCMIPIANAKIPSLNIYHIDQDWGNLHFTPTLGAIKIEPAISDSIIQFLFIDSDLNNKNSINFLLSNFNS